MAAQASAYPVTFDAEYPERLSRLSTAFRIALFIRVAIFLALLEGGSFNSRDFGDDRVVSLAGGGGIVLAIWAAIIVRQYVPHWLFDFQVALMRFEARAVGYLTLLTDRFPAFEGEYPIDFDVRYPERLNRWKVIVWKIITAIPHIIVLFVLAFALHTFVAGVFRWNLRVQAYIISLTDEYPPFSLR